MATDPKRHPMAVLATAEPQGYLANPSRAHLRVPREMLDPSHPLSPARTGEAATKWQALIDLYGLAAWDERSDRAHGVALTGTRWLEERWGWGRTKVRRFLVELEENGTISWMRGTVRREPSRILIVGYGKLQRAPRPGPVTSPVPGPGPVALSKGNQDKGYGDPAALSPGPVLGAGGVPPTKEEVTASYPEGDEGRGPSEDDDGFTWLPSPDEKKAVGAGGGRRLRGSAPDSTGKQAEATNPPDQEVRGVEKNSPAAGESSAPPPSDVAGGPPQLRPPPPPPAPRVDPVREPPSHPEAECADCGRPVPPAPHFAVLRCPPCAIKAGRTEAARRYRTAATTSTSGGPHA